MLLRLIVTYSPCNLEIMQKQMKTIITKQAAETDVTHLLLLSTLNVTLWVVAFFLWLLVKL